MPTPRQEKLAETIIANSTLKVPMTKGEMLEKAGYDKTTAEATPGRVIEATGVQEALAERGFTLDNAKKVVAQILLSETAKDRDKLTSADMIIKVHGGYAPEKVITQTQNNFFLSPQTLEASKRFEETLKAQLYESLPASEETQKPLGADGQGTGSCEGA